MFFQCLNIFIFELTSSKLFSALGGLSAIKSRKFSVCWYLGSNLAMVQSNFQNVSSSVRQDSALLEFASKSARKKEKKTLYQHLRIWLGSQNSRPTPELGPLQAEF